MAKDEQFIFRTGHDKIILALARYHYLMAEQVCRLLYSYPSSLREVRRLCAALVSPGEYAEYRRYALEGDHGSQRVYRLARKGRQYAKQHDVAIPGHYRPSEWPGHIFFRHFVPLTDFLI